jgi:hypothetical protein
MSPKSLETQGPLTNFMIEKDRVVAPKSNDRNGSACGRNKAPPCTSTSWTREDPKIRFQ